MSDNNFKKPPQNILYVEANRDGTVGGSYFGLLELIKKLDRRRFCPIVVFYRNNSLLEEFQAECQVVVLPERTIGKILGDILCLVDCMRLIITNSVSVVHLNNGPVLHVWLFACLMLRRKIVSHLRGYVRLSLWRRLFFSSYHRIIAISETVKTALLKAAPRLTRIVVVPNGIDLPLALARNKRPRPVVRAGFNLIDESALLVLLGNIRPWKGQEVAIEALRLVAEHSRNWRCALVGEAAKGVVDQAYLKRLEELVTKYNLGDQIVFTGYRDDVADILGAADVLLHTSITPEPFGRVILEAMAFSVPVISTRSGGPLEIIDDEVTGFLVPPGDASALAQRIAQLIDDIDLRRRVGEQGRRAVEERFSSEINARAIEAIYDQLTCD